MEECAHRAGSWDVQADCAEQVLRILSAGWAYSLRRVLGAALRTGLAWHAGNGPAHRAGGVDCAGAGVVGYQDPAAEGCGAGGDGGVDIGVGGVTL